MSSVIFGQEVKKLALVVDDEFINRSLLGNIISDHYEVIYAANGCEAMEQIRTNAGRLSIILLDLKMPVMDGYEVLGQLKEDPVFSKIPVIVLTAERQAEVDSLNLGAVDFIPKPYNTPEVILARIRRNIQLAEDTNIIQKTQKDELTGLYTREFFFQYVEQWNQYHPQTEMDAVALNINHFHMINELYGHAAGDRILGGIGRIISGILKKYNGLACRSEADNYLMYLPHQDDLEDTLKRLLGRIEPDGIFSAVRIRIGINQDVDKTIDMLQNFDRAMHACHTVRNNYISGLAFYNNELHEKEILEEHLIEDLETALERREFIIFYQPKYDIRKDRPVLNSAEALVRWKHPELGWIRPSVFIPLFEENGLIRSLDQYVWAEAAAQINRWKEQFGVVLPVSVNVSRIDVFDPDLERILLGLVEKNGIRTKDLQLEITESAYSKETDQITQVTEKLRGDGFSVELDDFGSGYSSLNSLTELPFDVLKLDMKFIRNMCSGEKNMRLIGLMLEIARFLGVPMIAEGVETEEQLKALKKLGCDIIQGFYFSRPVTAEEFVQFFKKNTYENIV